MRLRNRETGEEIEATLTTDHAASSYGLPVLVVGGEAYGTAEAAAMFEAEAVTREEAAELVAAGYGGMPTTVTRGGRAVVVGDLCAEVVPGTQAAAVASVAPEALALGHVIDGEVFKPDARPDRRGKCAVCGAPGVWISGAGSYLCARHQDY